MSFLIRDPDVSDDPMAAPCVQFDLPAATTIRVLPLTFATIPHRFFLYPPDESSGYRVWIVRNPFAFETLGLLVDQGPVPIWEGATPEHQIDLATRVFNLSQKTVKITKGTAVSRLVSLRLE